MEGGEVNGPKTKEKNTDRIVVVETAIGFKVERVFFYKYLLVEEQDKLKGEEYFAIQEDSRAIKAKPISIAHICITLSLHYL